MKALKQLGGVLLLLALGGLGAWALVRAGETEQAPASEALPPLVEVLQVFAEDVPVTVRAQGVVQPRTESALVAEVAGRVIWVSPALVIGGWFERGDALLRLDARDFELAVVQREAAVARSRLRLAQVQADAAVARREWASLGEGEASPLALREPQLAEAAAALAASEAELEGARLDVARTTLRAPFEGRVSQKTVDAGQFVGRGQQVALLHGIDVAEVRLPLPDEELAFLDLPRRSAGGGPEVVLRARFAGAEQAWTGRLVRMEGAIDPRSRMVHAVVEVADPQGTRGAPGQQPLEMGLFVQAEIAGRTMTGVHLLPRSAFRDSTTVLVVDEDDRLRHRSVVVARTDREEVFVSSGLRDGERVCVSALDAVTEGMAVRPRGPSPRAPLAGGVERVGS